MSAATVRFLTVDMQLFLSVSTVLGTQLGAEARHSTLSDSLLILMSHHLVRLLQPVSLSWVFHDRR